MDVGIEGKPWDVPLAVNATDAVNTERDGCPILISYLATRGLLGSPKTLMISAKDPWLRRFYRGIGEEFFDSSRRARFNAIICPNLSAYHHVEHRVWLDNRALIQLFMEHLLECGLPGIFFTYLEDSAVHRQWLVEYLRLNPTQTFVATGFDRKARGKFFRRRMEILADVEQRVGRPLRLVLNCIVSRLREIHYASGLFPGRIHLMGQSLFHKSAKGKMLSVGSRGGLVWTYAETFRPGIELFVHNAQVLETVIGDAVPDFLEQ